MWAIGVRGSLVGFPWWNQTWIQTPRKDAQEATDRHRMSKEKCGHQESIKLLREGEGEGEKRETDKEKSQTILTRQTAG